MSQRSANRVSQSAGALCTPGHTAAYSPAGADHKRLAAGGGASTRSSLVAEGFLVLPFGDAVNVGAPDDETDTGSTPLSDIEAGSSTDASECDAVRPVMGAEGVASARWAVGRGPGQSGGWCPFAPCRGLGLGQGGLAGAPEALLGTLAAAAPPEGARQGCPSSYGAFAPLAPPAAEAATAAPALTEDARHGSRGHGAVAPIAPPAAAATAPASTEEPGAVPAAAAGLVPPLAQCLPFLAASMALATGPLSITASACGPFRPQASADPDFALSSGEPSQLARAATIARARRHAVPLKVRLPPESHHYHMELDPEVPAKMRPLYPEFDGECMEALRSLKADLPLKKHVSRFLMLEAPKMLIPWDAEGIVAPR